MLNNAEMTRLLSLATSYNIALIALIALLLRKIEMSSQTVARLSMYAEDSVYEDEGATPPICSSCE